MTDLKSPAFRHFLRASGTSDATSENLSRAITPAALFALYLMGAYTGFSLFSNGTLIVPSVLCLLVGSIGFWLNFRAGANQAGYISSVSILAVTLGLQLGLIALRDGSWSGSSLRSALNLIYSIFVATGAILLARTIKRDQKRSIYLYAWVIILLGCIAELYLGLRPLSDAFRTAIYPASAYNAAARDLSLYGALRPSFFTLEPSYVGIWFTCFLFLWHCHGANNFLRAAIFVSVAAVGILIIRSPTIVFAFPLLVMSLVRDSKIFAKTPIAALLLALPLLLLGAGFSPSSGSGTLAFLAKASAFARIAGPFAIMNDVLSRWPTLGIGLGNQENLYSAVLEVYQQTRFAMQDATVNPRTMVANNFYLHFIYLGGLMGVASLYLYGKILSSLRIRELWWVLSCCILMLFNFGGYVTVQVWTVIALVASVKQTGLEVTQPIPTRVGLSAR